MSDSTSNAIQRFGLKAWVPRSANILCSQRYFPRMRFPFLFSLSVFRDHSRGGSSFGGRAAARTRGGGALREARSRLYRSQISQANTRWKAPDEIYKIYTLLHRSAFKCSAKFRQTFSHFHNFIFKCSLMFSKKLTEIEENFDWNYPEFQHVYFCLDDFYGKDQNLSILNLLDSQISLRFRNGHCRILQEMIFQRL